ncbi:MAG: outer membrane beta-barrel protein [Rhizobacter sp.]|nr:outer membrane beta-barrel protein [Bacteriovorax sp.]
MKFSMENKRVTFMSLFLATALIAATAGMAPKASAQDDVLDDAQDALSNSDTLDMDQIQIDGKLSASELMKKRREKLEERNKVMVEKKIEDIRVKQEMALTNKLQGAFNASLNNLNEDKVQVAQAAPAPAPVAPAPVIETRIVEVPAPVVHVEKKSKIIPMFGTQNIKGDKIDLDSNVTFGIQAETAVLPQLTVGLGLGYTTVDLTDVANNFVNNGYGSYYNNTSYTNTYGTNGRAMTLKKFTLEGNAKFFFIEDAMIKPYVGGAIAFNRSTLKYENQNATVYQNVNFGNEDYGSTAVSGQAKLGAEASFTDTIGLNVEFSYAKNISSGISKTAQVSSTTNPDQGRLENIQKDIDDGSVTAIQAGLVIKF